MINPKFKKITALTVCMSMLMAIPVFAGTSQNAQNNMNNMNMMNMQNGMLATSGAIQNGMQSGMGGMGGMQSGAQSSQQLSSAAQYMVSQGIIQGSSSGNYAMSENVKRCDMSLMLVRAFGLDTTQSSETSFSDVSQNSYYYDAVSTIQNLGIAQGDGQNFNPLQNMTLEEAILFVERALDAAGIDYSDVDIEALFEDRDLSEAATREDVSAILYAVLGDDYLTETTSSSADSIAYEADEDTVINFTSDDFYDACTEATEGTLDYVVFANPSTSIGKLYYGYDSSTDYDGKVSTNDEFYYDADEDNDELDLSDVTFVPGSDLSGTVVLNYTGYDTDETSFKGTVTITIDDDDDSIADNIIYTTDEDTAISFDQDDFNDACEDATGASLDYIKFTSLSSNATLYYGYEDEDTYDGAVTKTTKYYYASDEDDDDSISNITFVPDEDYTGTVKLTYTGYNEDGDYFTGTVKVTVE